MSQASNTLFSTLLFHALPLGMTSISLAFYITSKHLLGEVKNETKGQNGKLKLGIASLRRVYIDTL